MIQIQGDTKTAKDRLTKKSTVKGIFGKRSDALKKKIDEDKPLIKGNKSVKTMIKEHSKFFKNKEE